MPDDLDARVPKLYAIAANMNPAQLKNWEEGEDPPAITLARHKAVAPGRVNRLIRAGTVHLYPLDERCHYVLLKGVRKALEHEVGTVQKL